MGTEKRQILVVDDVELNRAILAELFQDSYEVLEAENGCQALELLEAHHDAILIVLLDIIMPVMDGFEMLQNMAHRTWKEEIPVVLITSENSDNALLKGYELGVSDIINKPFNPNIVKRRVDNTIELYLHKRHLEALVRQQVETLEKQTLKLNRFNEFIIDTLSTVVEFRSCESGTHIRRVREITRLLLESLSFRYPEYDLPHGAIDKMVSAASMHDIGKIAIPDAVLNKPGRLTAEEFEIMKTHSLKGCELLQSINEGQDEEYYRFCYDICRSHHERWDGSGYPDGLAGNNIPIWAQVVSFLGTGRFIGGRVRCVDQRARVQGRVYARAGRFDDSERRMRRLQSPAAEQLPERRLAAGKRGDRAHVQGTGGRTREAFAQKALTFGPDLVAARA